MKKTLMLLFMGFALMGCTSTGLAIDPRFSAPPDSAEFAAACADRAELATTYQRTDAQLQAAKGVALGLAALAVLPADALGVMIGAESAAKRIVSSDINDACRTYHGVRRDYHKWQSGERRE